VTPNTPAVFPPMPADYPKNRLGFAKWLVRRFIPQDLKVEMELQLAPAESRSSVLGAANPMRLGWTSWVAGPSFRGALPPVQHTLTSDAGDTAGA